MNGFSGPARLDGRDWSAPRLAGRCWLAPGRFASVSGVGGVFHYYWQVEGAVARPARYGVIFGLLPLARLVEAGGAAASRRARNV